MADQRHGVDFQRQAGGAVELRRGLQTDAGDLLGGLAAIIGGLHRAEGEVTPAACGPEAVKLLRAAVGIDGEDAVRVRGEAVELRGLVFLAFVRHGAHEVLGLQPAVRVAEGLEDRLGRGKIARALRIGEVAV